MYFRPPTRVPGPPVQPELLQRVRAVASAPGIHSTVLEGLFITRIDAPTETRPALYEPALCFVLQGQKAALLNTEHYRYDASNFLLVSVTLPLASRVIEASPQRPYLCLRLQVDRSELAELLLQMTAPVTTPAPASGGLSLAPLDESLQDALLRLMRLLETPEHLPVLAPLLRREIYYRALQAGAVGERLREQVRSESHFDRIANVLRLLRQRYAEPLRVEELAAAAHMSVSGLHAHFKSVTTLSPLQYQKQLRLHEARALMMTQNLDATVAAHRVGYESPSQFSREYRRLFGAPPVREVLARRQIGAGGRDAGLASPGAHDG